MTRFLEARAEVDPRDDQGRTPFLLAAGTGAVDIAWALWWHYADIFAVGEDGRNALNRAHGSSGHEAPFGPKPMEAVNCLRCRRRASSQGRANDYEGEAIEAFPGHTQGWAVILSGAVPGHTQGWAVILSGGDAAKTRFRHG